MRRSEPIGVRQFQILVVLFTIGTTILITPSQLASQLKQDAWVAPVIAVVPGLLLVMLYNKLIEKDPRATFVELCESVLGKWLGKAASILFVVFAFFAAALVLFDVGRFITTVMSPEIPVPIINMLFALLLVYAIRMGFDTLARMVELLFPAFVVLFLMMVVFVSPKIELEKIQPFMETGAAPVLASTLAVTSISFMPLVCFLMIEPMVTRSTESISISKAFFTAVLVGGVTCIVIVALTILVVGFNVASLQEYPVYYLAQEIRIGKFLERLEAVVTIMWLITTFVKLSVYFYAAVMGLVQTAKLTSPRSVLLPMGFLLVVLSVDIYPNSAFESRFNSADWIVWVFGVGVVLPLVVLAAHYGRGVFKKGDKG